MLSIDLHNDLWCKERGREKRREGEGEELREGERRLLFGVLGESNEGKKIEKKLNCKVHEKRGVGRGEGEEMQNDSATQETVEDDRR